MAPIQLNPVIAALPSTVPFVGPETLERRRGQPFLARMGANESPYGPAPSVIEAVAQATLDMGRYGDAELLALRTALGMRLGLAIDAITIGEGIDGLFATLCRLVLASGDRVVVSRGGYPTFIYHARAQGAEIVEIDYRGDANDLHALAMATREHGVKMVFLANPDNPTGSIHGQDAVAAFIEAIPPSVLVVLDEAYAEYAPAGTLPPTEGMAGNVLRVRTFSKAHGLAGMRVGYGFGDPGLIARFDAIRNHFGVTRLSQVAALEALRASAWSAEVVSRTREGLHALAAIARQRGLMPLPTATNFLAIDCGRDGDYAQAVLEGLAARGVFIRKPAVPGLDRLIRVSIGSPEEIAIFDNALVATLESLA